MGEQERDRRKHERPHQTVAVEPKRPDDEGHEERRTDDQDGQAGVCPSRVARVTLVSHLGPHPLFRRHALHDAKRNE